MISPPRKLAQIKRCLARSKDLGLGAIDTFKYVASVAVGRWPTVQSVVAINGGRMPIRWNRTDALILHQVMCSPYVVKFAPATILDLGANIGASVLYFSRMWPNASIACVEPQTENLALLRRTVELNHLPVEIFAGAVSTEDRMVEFFVSDDPSSNGLLSRPGWKSRTVPGFSVATIMQKMQWKQIDLLKIDIEGYELELLSRNAEWLACTREIVGEAHHEYSDGALLQDLARHGFVVEILSRAQKGGMRIFHGFNKAFASEQEAQAIALDTSYSTQQRVNGTFAT